MWSNGGVDGGGLEVEDVGNERERERERERENKNGKRLIERWTRYIACLYGGVARKAWDISHAVP